MRIINRYKIVNSGLNFIFIFCLNRKEFENDELKDRDFLEKVLLRGVNILGNGIREMFIRNTWNFWKWLEIGSKCVIFMEDRENIVKGLKIKCGRYRYVLVENWKIL